MIRIRISDPRSLGSWCIEGTGESTLVMDSSVPLMHRDPSDLGSLILIQIIPKERAKSLSLPPDDMTYPSPSSSASFCMMMTPNLFMHSCLPCLSRYLLTLFLLTTISWQLYFLTFHLRTEQMNVLGALVNTFMHFLLLMISSFMSSNYFH